MQRPLKAPSNVTLVVLGKALGAHGTRGELRVRWMGDGPGNLMRAPRIALGESSEDPAARWYEVKAVAPGRGGEVRVEVRGIETREAAAALAGLLVLGDSSHLEPLPAGEHYWYEWIGCAVEASDGRKLGIVKELWEAGAHDVLVVEDEAGRQLLLPAAGALLREVDVAGRRIVIEVPAGLLDPL
jgi:16S rRNA processing protein RimM